MAGLSFKVLMQLQTKQFNSAVNQVKQSLNSLKSTFVGIASALAGGLGFANLISSFKETSTKLSTLQATLKNVSNDFNEYSDNLTFLQRISNAYGQDLASLTDGYAKFRAAAKDTNLTVSEQRVIYEALTRAAGAYHLSAADTSNAMLAVSQMFSKGKVTAEELRRQLGNTLPGAFNLMAKAAGIAGITMNGTTKELEDMMRAGNVITEEIMPAFAQVLNATTAGATFDSLQSSLNRLSNAWYNFVSNSEFGDFFKKFVDAGTDALNYLSKNFDNFKGHVLGVGAALATGFSLKGLGKAANAEMEGMKKDLATYDAELKKSEKNLKTLEALEKKIKDIKEKTKENSKGEFSLHIGENVVKSLNLDTSNFVKEDNNGHTYYRTKTSLDEIKKLEKDIAKEKNLQADLQKKINRLTEETNKSLTVGRQISLGLLNIFKTLGSTILNSLSTLAISALVGLIVDLGAKLINIIKTNYELEHQTETIMQNVKKTADAYSEQFARVDMLRKALGSANKENIINQLNEAMGLAGKNMLTIKSTAEEINAAISKWKDGIKSATEAGYVFNKIQELTKQNIELEARNAEIGDKGTAKERRLGSFGNREYYKYPKLADEYNQNQKQIEANRKSIEELYKYANKNNLENPFDTSTNGKTSGGISDEAMQIQAALKKYKDELNALNNQKTNGAINNEEYSKRLIELQKNTFETIAAFDNLDEKLKELSNEDYELFKNLKIDFFNNLKVANLDGLKAKIDKFIEKENEKLVDEVQKDIEKLNKESDKEFKKSLKDYFYNYYKKLFGLEEKKPQKGDRNPFFDYKKKDYEIFGENADINDDYVKELEKYRDELLNIQKEYGHLDDYGSKALNRIVELLKAAKKEAADMREKAQIAEWINDVEELGKKYDEAIFNAFKNGASSISQLASGVHSLAEAFATLSGGEISKEMEEVFNKIDAVISIINTLIQTINTVSTVVEGFNKIREAGDAASAAMTLHLNTLLAEKLGLIQAESAMEVKSAVDTVAAETTKKGAVDSTTSALAGQAIAGAASSQSSIPVVGPILAAVAVAGIVALLASSMAKFANGGIVGGNSTSGDKNVVRANSGELILTKSQQGTLYKAIASGNLGSGNVEFKLRGTDLIGSINNTQRKLKGI